MRKRNDFYLAKYLNPYYFSSATTELNMYRNNYRKESSSVSSGGIFRKIKEFCSALFRSRRQRRIRALQNAVPDDPAQFFGCGEILVRRIANSTAGHYRKFFLWKDKEQTKKRWIEAPDRELKAMQELILRKILYRFAPSQYAHGFIAGRSIVSNAKTHTGMKYIIKLDLKDFFPSITRTMIREHLDSSGIVTRENSVRIELLLNLCLLEDRLPQGAPTSPAISNLVCRKLDFILAKFARRHRMKYTRYADDLTFSGDSDICFRLIPVIKKIIGQYGFKVNERKVNVLKRHQRQTVTGIVVNHRGTTSVPRRKRMKLRAFLHQIITGKIPPGKYDYAKLKGHISFICMANPEQGKYFMDQLAVIEKMRKRT